MAPAKRSENPPQLAGDNESRRCSPEDLQRLLGRVKAWEIGNT
jgi:hypothetical protein